MHHITQRLWRESEYISQGPDAFAPTLDTYVLSGNRVRGAVVLCPGGGYASHTPGEGEPIALQFNAAGFHAFVVRYSLAPKRYPQALLDLSKAICIIRKNASDWHVDSDCIAVCGFSAGGHLAASLAVLGHRPYVQDALGTDAGLNLPNALILGYPVILSGEFAHRASIERLLGPGPDQALLDEVSLEKGIHRDMPPTFLWHTVEDAAVPVENSLLFAAGLRRNAIPFELHLYPNGPHGLSLASAETVPAGLLPHPHVATWLGLCLEWLRALFPK